MKQQMEQPEQEGAPLVGFLFGNVDEKNRVEADYLDDVSSRSAEDSGASGSSPFSPCSWQLTEALTGCTYGVGALAPVEVAVGGGAQ